MNTDILKGKWKQIQGEAKKWWGDLTDDELTRVDGEQDKLVGLLQEKYGYSKEKAEAAIDQRLTEYERSAR